jgi:hypothetical protein
MPDTAQSLTTPDPILTTEGIGAFVVAVVANAYILFGSNLDNGRQTALASLVTSLWLVFTLVHGAVVRKGRAAGGGLVGTIINEIPVAGSDAGDAVAAKAAKPPK